MHDITNVLSDDRKSAIFSRTFAEGYLSPAFGARSKSETDLLVFTALIEAGALDPAAQHHTRPGAKPDLQLAAQESGVQDRPFHSAARCASDDRFSKDGTLLTFGIESPLLKEAIVARLKEKGVFADTTFSREIVRMPLDAFVEFLESLLTPEVKADFVRRLVADRQLPDRSFRALAAGVLGKLGEKVAGKAGEAAAGGIVDATGPAAERLGGFIAGLLDGKPAEAVRKLAKEDLPC